MKRLFLKHLFLLLPVLLAAFSADLWANLEFPAKEVRLLQWDGKGTRLAACTDTELFDGHQFAGTFTYTADVGLLTTGIYYLRLTTPQGRTGVPLTVRH